LSLAPSIAAGGLLYPERRTVGTAIPSACANKDFEGDGVTLRGWHCTATGKRRGTVVYLHGIADNRGSSAGAVDRFTREGFDVVAYDSRRHGDSDGEVLAVVHDHQGSAIPEMIEHRGQYVPVDTLRRGDRVGDCPGDERRVADRCEVDEPDTVFPVGGASDPVFGDQTGLAETARSDDAHEPGSRDEVGQRAEIVVPSDDRGRRPDEIVPVGRENTERRELSREVRRRDLEQLDRVIEVTDPIATERYERLAARTAHLLGCLGGHHDLAAVPGVHHSRRLVHGERDVVIPMRRGETRMNPHAHPDHRVGRPRLG
jgi:hypothetical protein